jgi:hypothetical protein
MELGPGLGMTLNSRKGQGQERGESFSAIKLCRQGSSTELFPESGLGEWCLQHRALVLCVAILAFEIMSFCVFFLPYFIFHWLYQE